MHASRRFPKFFIGIGYKSACRPDLHADVIGSFAGFRLLVEEHHVVARPDGEPVVIGPGIGPLRRLPGQSEVEGDSGNAERRGAVAVIPSRRSFAVMETIPEVNTTVPASASYT